MTRKCPEFHWGDDYMYCALCDEHWHYMDTAPCRRQPVTSTDPRAYRLLLALPLISLATASLIWLLI